MAKGSTRRLDTLKEECEKLNLNPIPTKHKLNPDRMECSKDDYVRALQAHFIEVYKSECRYSKALDYILKLDSPMLALQIKHMSEDIQEKIYNDRENWIAEEKIDGNRLMIAWFKDDKRLLAYSRNCSVSDFLPIEYGNKLYDEVDISLLEDVPDFIIDCELVLNDKNVNKGEQEEIVADTQLNMVSAILSADYDLSKQYQQVNPIKAICFDILWYDDKELINLPLRDRKKYLDLIFDKIKSIINIEKVPNQGELTTKEYFDLIVSQGGEGVVAKDLNATYDIKGKRDGRWVKIKRTVSGSLLNEKLGDTLDAFVIGFNKGREDTRNENLIGSLNFGMYLLDSNNNLILDENGNPVIHHIATVGSLPDLLRENITYIDENGEPALKGSIYGKVATIDAQDISSKQFRFMHARIIEWRVDRSPESCKIQVDFIKSLVL